ncbi:MAG: hypothetical protein ACXVHB_06115 [Solirubrobacteraceae bacterium]
MSDDASYADLLAALRKDLRLDLSNLEIPPVTWYSLAPFMLNNWVLYSSVDATFPDAQFCKDQWGFVHLRGLVRNTAAYTYGAATATPFQLPAGYRPTDTSVTVSNNAEFFICYGIDGGGHNLAVRLDVRKDGTAVLATDVTGLGNGTAGGWVDLSAVTFEGGR